MILYLDTSALVKLYIEEVSQDRVLKAVAAADTVATNVVAYVETYATFARLQRENKLTQNQHEYLKNAFQEDWNSFLRIELIESVLRQAAKLTELLALRAYDSLHLATAQLLAKKSQSSVTFACFDHKLNQAADVLGLTLL